jgi:hypothetical protein
MRQSLLAKCDYRHQQVEEKVVALITKEPPVEKKDQLNIRIDPVGDLLRSYCELIDSGQHYVVEQALRYTFGRDKEFQAWLKRNRTTGKRATHHQTEAAVSSESTME